MQTTRGSRVCDGRSKCPPQVRTSVLAATAANVLRSISLVLAAVWMWKNPRNHWPKQFDIGRMTFPTHLPTTGPHVIHWLWRGYRDCIDVDVLPLSTLVQNASGAMYGYRASTTPDW